MKSVIFPPKCVLCGRILEWEERDLCAGCRKNAPVFLGRPDAHPHLAKCICLWYYKDNVRLGIRMFKFRGRRAYAKGYGRLLAEKLSSLSLEFDVLTWAPVSLPRLIRRGYDQSALLAKELGKNLGRKPVRTLYKHRNPPPQTSCNGAAARRANVLGAYRCTNPALVRGKRILLIDDIVTTGSTAGECARVLLTAGAKEVVLAALASGYHQQQ